MTLPLRQRRPSGSALRFDDAEPVTIVLVRHGETAATVARTLSGSGVPGPGLSPAGRVQAAQAADLVARIGRSAWTDLPHPDAVLASPMVRTQETAAAIGRRLGRQVRTDPRIAECDFGTWEGQAPDALEADGSGGFRAWHADPTVRPPEGESLVDVGERVWGLLTALEASDLGHTVVLVSHVMAVRAAVGRVLDLPAPRWAALRVTAASVTIVRLWADGDRELVTLGYPSARSSSAVLRPARTPPRSR